MPIGNSEVLFLLGVMGAAFALTALFTHGLQPIQRWPLVVTLTAAAGFGLHRVADLPGDPFSPLLFLAVGIAAVVLYRSFRFTRAGRRCAAFLGIPQARWGLALAVALIVSFRAVIVLDGTDAPPFNPPAPPTFVVRDQLRIADRPPALTDRGQDVALWELPAADVPQLAEADLAFLRSFATEARAIRTAEADGHSNCHGWVFAGGRYWVRSEVVDEILHDNGYLEAANPRVGDVVVYRDTDGKILHSGVVRGTSDDGHILVESKWGPLGRFMHLADDQPYPGAPTFYHSRRGGNLIRGVDASPSPVRSLNGG